MSVAAILVLAGAGLAGPPTILEVPDDFSTIQAAIDAAVDGDEIHVAPGTYVEMIDLLGKAIAVRGIAGAERTIIDAAGAGKVVTCKNGEPPETLFEGLTITGGVTGTNGGGMTIRAGSSPTIVDCVFTGNEAVNGGGVSVRTASSPVFLRCVFHENEADDGRGGGMYVESSATLTDCTFTDNLAIVFGGGLFSTGEPLSVVGCLFAGNCADQGGGLYVAFGPSNEILACEFDHNLANTGSGLSVVNPVIHDCVVTGNVGGGAARCSGLGEIVDSFICDNGNDGIHSFGFLTVTNCLIARNVVDGVLDGAPNLGHLTLLNCTIAHNGQAGVDGYFPGGETIRNCIIWPNVVMVSAPDMTYCVIGNHPPNDLVLQADPLFVDSDAGDYRLQPGSPAIDSGTNDAVPPSDNGSYDLDGAQRVEDGDGNGIPTVDMGAYEAVAIEPVCWGDFNADGFVDVTDLTLLVLSWGTCLGCPMDQTEDGFVDVLDLIELVVAWGDCAG